jgi:hypothetical protein
MDFLANETSLKKTSEYCSTVGDEEKTFHNFFHQTIHDNKTFLELVTTIDNMQQFVSEKEKMAQVSVIVAKHLFSMAIVFPAKEDECLS